MKLPFGLVIGKDLPTEPDYTKFESDQVVFNYASTNYVNKEGITSIKNIKSGDEVERVSKDKLELIRRREPLVSNAINIYVECVKDAEIEVISNDAKAKKVCEEFLIDSNFKSETLSDIVGDMCTFGTSWHELVWNEVGDRVVGLDVLDAKFMDMSRAHDGKVIFDNTGMPSYYVQYIPYAVKVPENLPVVNQNGNNALKFERKEILKIDMYTVGGSQNGVGIIEPVYNTILNKLDMQAGLAQSTLRLGFPIIGAKVGNDKVYPNKTLMQTAANIFKNINESTGFAIPYFFEPLLIEPKRSERVQQNLTYFTEQIVAGLGVPKSILTGKGEQENKQTLVELKDMFLRSRIGSIQEKISNTVSSQVFGQLAKVNGWKEVPKMRFVKRNRYDVDEVIALRGAGIIDQAGALSMLR